MGFDGIARAKYELIEALPADGVAVLNADDEWVAQFGDARFGREFGERAVFYGTGRARGCDARRRSWRSGLDGVCFTVNVGGERATGAAEADGAAQCTECAGGDCGGRAVRDGAGGVCGGGWGAAGGR